MSSELNMTDSSPSHSGGHEDIACESDKSSCVTFSKNNSMDVDKRLSDSECEKYDSNKLIPSASVTQTLNSISILCEEEEGIANAAGKLIEKSSNSISAEQNENMRTNSCTDAGESPDSGVIVLKNSVDISCGKENKASGNLLNGNAASTSEEHSEAPADNEEEREERFNDDILCEHGNQCISFLSL